jgi:hypothetical protein
MLHYYGVILHALLLILHIRSILSIYIFEHLLIIWALFYIPVYIVYVFFEIFVVEYP